MVCNPIGNGPKYTYENVRSQISDQFETLSIEVLQNTATTSTFAHQPCFKSTGLSSTSHSYTLQ